MCLVEHIAWDIIHWSSALCLATACECQTSAEYAVCTYRALIVLVVDNVDVQWWWQMINNNHIACAHLLCASVLSFPLGTCPAGSSNSQCSTLFRVSLPHPCIVRTHRQRRAFRVHSVAVGLFSFLHSLCVRKLVMQSSFNWLITYDEWAGHAIELIRHLSRWHPNTPIM